MFDRALNVLGRRNSPPSRETPHVCPHLHPNRRGNSRYLPLRQQWFCSDRSKADRSTDCTHRLYGRSDRYPGRATGVKKSKNKDVRAFASDMVRDHTAVNNKALALLKKLKVKPEDNDTSRQLSKQASDKRAELSKLNGSAFDKAYVDNEVAYHKTVNDALQNTLIPSASNQELKDLLTTGLKIFQGHQQHAEQVATEFK